MSADDEFDAFVHPHQKFEVFLDQKETKLAAMLEHFGLPKPGRFVVRDKDTPRGWRYRIKTDDRHEKGTRRTEWFLMTWRERTDSFWYLGKLLLLLQQCRSAIDREAWLELAGRAFDFGCEWREMELMFPAELGPQAFEKQITDGADKGNATKKQNAAKWKETARHVLSTHPEIDPHNALNAAREILKNWPADKRKPSERTLRAYIAKPA